MKKIPSIKFRALYQELTSKRSVNLKEPQKHSRSKETLDEYSPEVKKISVIPASVKTESGRGLNASGEDSPPPGQSLHPLRSGKQRGSVPVIANRARHGATPRVHSGNKKQCVQLSS
ncbi:hypothetical protein TNCV_2903731 [Trichonephila clavipes]|nr:hypothetical protein TNCV_2903731 [Trichonephila clavipes]